MNLLEWGKCLLHILKEFKLKVLGMRIKGSAIKSDEFNIKYWFLLYPLNNNLNIEYPNSNHFRNVYIDRIRNCIFEINPHFPAWTNSWKNYPVFCTTREMGLSAMNPVLPLDDIKIQGAKLFIQNNLKGKKIIRFHQFENKNYEKDIISFCRDNGIATIGYINGIPNKLDRLVTNKDAQPDLLLSSSRYVTDYICQLGYKGAISNTYNIRQKFYSHPSDSRNKSVTLVLFPINSEITTMLHSFVLELARQDHNSQYWLKSHPFGTQVGTCSLQNVKILDDLGFAMEKASRVLFMSGTTVAFEALCNGLQLIKYCPSELPDTNDGFQGELRKYVSKITSIEDFMKTSHSLDVLPIDEVKQLQNYMFNADITEDDFWLQVDKFETDYFS